MNAIQVRPESVVRYMAGGADPCASVPGAQANPIRALTKLKLVPSWVKERPCGRPSGLAAVCRGVEHVPDGSLRPGGDEHAAERAEEVDPRIFPGA